MKYVLSFVVIVAVFMLAIPASQARKPIQLVEDLLEHSAKMAEIVKKCTKKADCGKTLLRVEKYRKNKKARIETLVRKLQSKFKGLTQKKKMALMQKIMGRAMELYKETFPITNAYGQLCPKQRAKVQKAVNLTKQIN
ncbi:MAG: hypothetical protein JRJ19_13060 [Deltaproteobacteria bacterium]|nr:hypothetical protein [Deltaproteobacteria bacterium]MBW1872993.1 hypothetical protein [Deltaproteobacteria bacterium]